MNRGIMAFALVLVSMSWLLTKLRLPYEDEVWLISGLIASLLLYWIASNKEGYWTFTGPILLVVLGAYFIAVKAPKLLSTLMSYRLAQFCCFALYGIFGWLIVKRWRVLDGHRQINPGRSV